MRQFIACKKHLVVRLRGNSIEAAAAISRSSVSSGHPITISHSPSPTDGVLPETGSSSMGTQKFQHLAIELVSAEIFVVYVHTVAIENAE